MKLHDVHLHCTLGGYENTLLGYRTRLYKSIVKAGLQKRIDVVMFGHVIYELACGRELGRVCPEESDYENCDTGVREVLEKIFNLERDLSMEEVSPIPRPLPWGMAWDQ